jgi:magnesium-transporting ATPase (P-type)
MITGDNPLTAVHVARDVEIVDREVMILDLKEGTSSDGTWNMTKSCHGESPADPR